MKSQLHKIGCTFALAIGLLLGSSSVLAGDGWRGHHGWHGGGGWHHGGSGVFIGINPGFYSGYPYYQNYYQRCFWVGGHYNRWGYWVPPHRVCR